jgi:hypothetical protein
MLPYTSQRRHHTSRSRTSAARVSVTRFFSAARQWDVETVQAALSAHPEFVGATDRQGRTALHLTATADARRARRPVSASVAVARALLAHGADINAVHPIRDAGDVFPGRALWHAVARGGNRALARFLLRQGANPDFCYWAVVWSDDVATARLLGERAADVNLRFHGESPLLYATRLRRTRMMRWLLDHGADVNLADSEGRSPLHHAIQRRHPLPELRLLIDAGASLTQPAADGSTPLSMAGKRLAALLRLEDTTASGLVS